MILKKTRILFFDSSSIDDINECYMISDILITDYSSVFFDFANLTKPILFYMYDLMKYKNDLRGFYLDESQLPGPISENEEDLLREIINTDTIKQTERINNFKMFYCPLDDGASSKRAIDILFKEDK